MPPPRAVPEELTWLALMKEPVIVALPPVVLRPPPLDVAVLLMMLLEATVSVPWLAMPPPATAELFLTLVPVTVVEPRLVLDNPPPLPVAELALTVQLLRLVVPVTLPK